MELMIFNPPLRRGPRYFSFFIILVFQNPGPYVLLICKAQTFLFFILTIPLAYIASLL